MPLRQQPTPEVRQAAAARDRDVGVFLCDDAPALRRLLRAYLEREGGFAVVGECGDGERLAERVRAAAADAVVLDLSMPRVDGLEALAALRAAHPELGIVVLSGFDRATMAARALALGADRYVEKAAGMEQLRAALQAVCAERRAKRGP
jgi:DNA-binding NarL/FixJ family response regulator